MAIKKKCVCVKILPRSFKLVGYDHFNLNIRQFVSIIRYADGYILKIAILRACNKEWMGEQEWANEFKVKEHETYFVD